jgi:uncharacterized protein YecT (DUF1311 family)
MVKQTLFLLLLMTIMNLPAVAQDSCNDKAQANCSQQSSVEDDDKEFELKPEDPCHSGGALGQGECANQRFRVADKKLNELYKKLMNALPPDGKDSFARASLVRAQKAWIQFKESNCDFYGEVNGGVQMWKSTYTMFCRADVTERRVKDFEEYLKPYTE